MASKYLVIGDGVAGATAAETIRKQDEDADITVLTDEKEPLYNRIMLKSFMKGQLPLHYTRVHNKAWYEKRDIDLQLETRVSQVDREGKKVETENGSSRSYDRLLVATGGSPRKLSFDEGYGNVYYMWTMEDAERIKEAAEDSEKAVVIGGGLLGIDLAVAFAENDAETYYLVREENWWSKGLDWDGAEIIHRKLEEKGVEVVTGTEARSFETENGEVTAVETRSGETYGCDSVAVAIGQDPNSSIIDVEKNDKEMIQVDEHLQTSDRDVYAAGNMVEYRSPVFGRRIHNGSWDHSEAMGRTAGTNMVAADFSDEKCCSEQQSREDCCGQQEFDYVNTYGVGHFDVQFLAIGDWSGESLSRKYSRDEYRRLFFRDRKLVGAVMIGHTSGQEQLRKQIQAGWEFENRQKLLEKD